MKTIFLIMLMLTVCVLVLVGQPSPGVPVLFGAPPGGVGSACTAPQLAYMNTTTGCLASCQSSVWTCQGGSGGLNLWTESGGVLSPTTQSDLIKIGSSAPTNTKFAVRGDSPWGLFVENFGPVGRSAIFGGEFNINSNTGTDTMVAVEALALVDQALLSVKLLEGEGIHIQTGGSVTNAYGLFVDRFGNANITNGYGVWIGKQTPAVNAYGLYVEDFPDGGTAIRTGPGIVYHGDTVKVDLNYWDFANHPGVDIILPNDQTADALRVLASDGSTVKSKFTATGGVVVPTLGTMTNCSSSASPAVCGSAASGSVVIAAAATTVTVNTTAVTADSQILVTPDQSLGTKLGVTCNTQSLLTLGPPKVTARTGGTSFAIDIVVGPTTNPLCLSYAIVN